MMKVFNKKQIVALVMLLVLLLVLTGCRQAPAPEPEEELVEAPETELPEEEEEEAEEPENNGMETQLIEVEGRYVGFADSHSVEIELIGESQEFMVFQLDDPVRDQLEQDEYDSGTEVIIKYRALDQGQPMIMEIEEK